MSKDFEIEKPNFADPRRRSEDIQRLTESGKKPAGINVTVSQILIFFLCLFAIGFVCFDRMTRGQLAAPGDGSGAQIEPVERSSLGLEAEEICFKAYIGYFRSFAGSTAGLESGFVSGSIKTGPGMQKFMLDETLADKNKWLIPMFKAGDRITGIGEDGTGTFVVADGLEFAKGQAAATKRINELLKD